MANYFSEAELRELARVYHRSSAATALLQRAGIDRSIHPVLGLANSQEFWGEVDELFASGRVTPDVARQVLRLARRDYPGNVVFAGAGAGQAPNPPVFPANRGAGGDIFDNTSGGRGGSPFSVMGTIVVVDAVGYSRNGTLVQIEWRRAIRDMTVRALVASSIPVGHAYFNDRGDGFMAVIDGDVPPYTVLVDLTRELGIELGEYNQGRNEQGRLRLRVGMHQGLVFVDDTGIPGGAAIVGARLVDAQQLRNVMKEHPDLNSALIVSDDLYRSIVMERFRGLAPESFERVEVSMDKYDGVAWIAKPAAGGFRPAAG